MLDNLLSNDEARGVDSHFNMATPHNQRVPWLKVGILDVHELRVGDSSDCANATPLEVFTNINETEALVKVVSGVATANTGAAITTAIGTRGVFTGSGGTTTDGVGVVGSATAASGATVTTLYGGNFSATASSGSTVTTVIGLLGAARNEDDSTTSMMGVWAQTTNPVGSTVTNSYALYAVTGNSGTVTNEYGLYIGTSGSGTETNKYGVYVASAAADNYFAGTLEVAGALTADSIVVTNAVTVDSVATTGAVTAASVAATGAVTGATVAATGAMTAASVAATGDVSGATGTFPTLKMSRAAYTQTGISSDPVAVTTDAGTVTTVALTTAAGNGEIFSLTRAGVNYTNAVVMLTLNTSVGTGSPDIACDTRADGYIAIQIRNRSAADAFNDVVVFDYLIIRAA